MPLWIRQAITRAIADKDGLFEFQCMIDTLTRLQHSKELFSKTGTELRLKILLGSRALTRTKSAEFSKWLLPISLEHPIGESDEHFGIRRR